MPAPLITQTITAPVRGSGGVAYTAAADAFAAALPPWASQANALATYLDGLALAATGTGNFTNITATGTVSAGGLVIMPATPQTVQTASTAVANFPSLSANARQHTVIFNGLSTNGTSPLILRIGASAGVEATGYVSASQSFNSGSTAVPAVSTATTGFVLGGFAAADTISGAIRLESIDGAGLTWAVSGTIIGTGSGTTTTAFVSGVKTLAGVMDRLRVTTVGGTDTFDAGTLNVVSR